MVARAMQVAADLLGIMSTDQRRPVDMREVILRLVDDSAFLEFGAGYGSATVCGNASGATVATTL